MNEIDWKSEDEQTTVCYCANVNKKTIVSAINEGSNDIKSIQEKTGAGIGTQCKELNPKGGCCHSDINELINIYGKSSDSCSTSCCCSNDNELSCCKIKKVVVIIALIISICIVLYARQQDANIAKSANTAIEKEILLPRLLDLGAEKCVACKAMVPVLDNLETEFKGELQVDFIDVWKNEAEAKKYKISSIPTQIFFDKNGKELYRHIGFISKEDILKKFEELKVELTVKNRKKDN